MSAPSNGVYNIRNVGTSLYVDLTGSNSNDGTLIIGHPLNTQPSGTSNQQFTLTVLPDTTICTLRVVGPTSWVRIKNDSFAENNNVIGSSSPTPVSIEPVGSGKYMIKIPNIDLCFTLKSSQQLTPVVLAPSNDSDSQLWTFESV